MPEEESSPNSPFLGADRHSITQRAVTLCLLGIMLLGLGAILLTPEEPPTASVGFVIVMALIVLVSGLAGAALPMLATSFRGGLEILVALLLLALPLFVVLPSSFYQQPVSLPVVFLVAPAAGLTFAAGFALSAYHVRRDEP
ncbi:hypothetical protein [Amaricoccus sp.]|uniref:hypothetical protein n=1 Tax=Amaricoccus sp. TaxID=1872485 RepID=UPI001B547CC7|nr:hypothetical protein [Amaricoccus sp.]MBP7243255.1 hypothetical protein [Amaricoccus sp.]